VKFTKIKAAVLSAAMAATCLAVSVPAAHAAGTHCNPNPGGSPRYPIGTEDIQEFGRVWGQLYIGYIPDCRYEYAEVHFHNSGDAVLSVNSMSIWLEDAAGNHLGQVSTGWTDVTGDYYFGSNMINIGYGSDPWYYFSQPYLYVNDVKEYFGTARGGTAIPECPSATYNGGSHDYYNGSTITWNMHGTC
jgi:hypothetical protein